MQYHSTISHCNDANLQDAIIQTVASDSGLLMPDSIPVIPRAIIATFPEMQLADIAYFIAATLFDQDMELDDIRRITLKTYSHSIPLIKLDKSISALELWHGPTGTAKDFEVEFLAGMLECLAINKGKQIKILATATSNAAKAIVNTYANRNGFSAILLVPRIGANSKHIDSNSHTAQNIKFIDVRGTKHQCHRLVLEALNDTDFQKHNCFTAASTLNIGALLPQIIHFFYGYSRAVAQGAHPQQVVFSIPCNNLAGLTAAVMAKRMGLPVKRIIAAGNSTFHLSQYLESGIYPCPAIDRSLPYALEASQPTNLPRIKELLNESQTSVYHDITAQSYDDEEIANAIITAQCSMHYDLDSHSACALKALTDSISEGESGIILSTNNPFPQHKNIRHPAIDPIAPSYAVLKQILSNC